VGIGVTVSGGGDTGIGADENAYQIRLEYIDKRGEMSVFRGSCILARLPLLFGWAWRCW
jgi:hypothetical protein